MARGVGVLFRLILEGIVAYVLAKGMTAAMGALSKTRLGVRFAAWVEANWTSWSGSRRYSSAAAAHQGSESPDGVASDAR